MYDALAASTMRRAPLPADRADQRCQRQCKRRVGQRPEYCVGEERRRLASQFAEVPRSGEAHVEQEKCKHAPEQVAGERLHQRLSHLAGREADRHRAEQQELRAVGEGLPQDLADRCACARRSIEME